MELNPIVLSIPIYFTLIAIEWIIDLFSREKFYRLGDAFTNISCGIFEQVTGVFAKVFVVGIYHLIYSNFHLFEIPRTWLTSIALFIAVDFFYYWAHRHSHEINLFWLGHVVHHQSEDYNLSVALRQGAFQKVFTFAYFLPLALLGFETLWFVYISAFVTLYQFWIHTERIRKMPRWFEYIFNTPSHHRVHHGRNPQYIDRNHAGTLIIWDRMFGTFEPEVETVVYGITTPTGTYNAIQAHIHPFQVLWKQVKETPHFVDKVRLIFNSPGWTPNGQMAIEKVNADVYRKFDFNIPRPLAAYTFFQFIVLIAFTALFLFTAQDQSTSNLILGLAAILIGLFGVGAIFEHSRRAKSFEPLRVLLFASLLYFSDYPIAPTWTLTYSVISLITLIAIRNKT